MHVTDEDRALLQRIRANFATLEACPLHDFEKVGHEPLDATHRCKNCGGTLRHIHVNWYNRGLAHGKAIKGA